MYIGKSAPIKFCICIFVGSQKKRKNVKNLASRISKKNRKTNAEKSCHAPSICLSDKFVPGS